jgi:hypothetical protein
MATIDNLNALHQTFDGIIPAAVLAVAKHGTPEMVALVCANGEIAFAASMVRGQIKTIRARRVDGSYYPALINDLQLYRRQFRAWNKLAHDLRREIAGETPAIRNAA